MSDIINSLISEGIIIKSFNEFNTTVYNMFPFLEVNNEGYY